MREHWTTPRFCSKAGNFLWIGLFCLLPGLLAQTATYHLHTESPTSGAAQHQLLSAPPDVSSVAFLSGPLVAPDDYFIADFETTAGVPGISGYIPANSTFQFNLWMRKTSSAGVVYPKVAVYLNCQSGSSACGGQTGTLLCMSNGPSDGSAPVPLGVGVTQMDIGCKTQSAVDIGSSDRFYVWVGASEFSQGIGSLKGELDIEGTAAPVYDSTVTVALPTAAPSITSIGTLQAPSTAQAAVGGTVNISGMGFGLSQGNSVVTFNGVAAGLCSPAPGCWGSNLISINVPVGATTGNVVVTVNGVSSNGVSLSIVPPPVITAVMPTTGVSNWIPVGGGIVIQGSNFGPSGTVTINGVSATVTNWTATAVTTAVPGSITPSTIPAVVYANGIASQPFQFVAHKGPAFDDSEAPACLAQSKPATCVPQGAIGALVNLTGTNFGQTQGDSTVKFGGVQVPSTQITQFSASYIQTPIPTGVTPGTVNVVVTVDAVDSSPTPFTVTSAPAINNLATSSCLTPVSSCSSGSNCEGALQVLVCGSNFGSSPGTVSFNGTLATVGSGNWTATQITTTIPVGAGTGPVVVNTNGASSNGVTFTVLPNITQPLSPTSGPIGTLVKITGTGFGVPQGTGTVTFNGTTAKPVSWSDTSISVPVPMGATSGNVVVTVGGATTSASFTVTASPSITSLSTTSGVIGALVGINGSAFGSSQGSSLVRFNGVTAQVCTSSCSLACSGGAGWSDSCVAAYVSNGATTGPVSVTVNGVTAAGPSFTVSGPGVGQISGTVSCTGTHTITVQALRQGTVQGSTTTTCGGSYTISSLPADSYDVQASTSGLGTATQNAVSVAIGGTTSGINFSLDTAGTISGSITNANGGGAINGATVQVYVGSALISTINTGSGNTYTVNTLNAGIYRVQASAPNFTPAVITQNQIVTLSAGGTTTQNFALQPQGNNAINYSYDNLGRLVTVRDQGGDTAIYSYDAVGNITRIDRRSASQVTILSLDHPTAAIGSTLTITGTGFSTTAGQDLVQFTGASAAASTASSTQLTVAVPSGAITGPLSVNVNGTVSNNLPFTVLASGGVPTITNVSPLQGLNPTTFTVTGTNFDTDTTKDEWRLNISPLAVTGGANPLTTINTTVPLNTASGHVSVTTPAGTAVSSQDFIVPPPDFSGSTIASATRISFPGSGTVTNLGASSVAIFLFDATGGQRESINITSTSLTNCQLIVYAPNDVSVGAGANCSSTGLSSYALPLTGTYTVAVFNLSTSTGNLAFTLNNATDFSSTITFGQTVTVPITTAGQTGRLTFFAPANKHISVNVVAGLGSACSLTLLGPANQTLQSVPSDPYHFTPVVQGTPVAPGTQNCSTTGNLWDIGYLPSLAGMYTIVVAPQGTTGSVQLQLVDSTDSIPAPISPSSSGTVANLSTTVVGQNIQQVFSGTAGQKISLLVNSLSSNLSNKVDLWILGPGNTLLGHTRAFPAPFFIDPRDPLNPFLVLPATGNYTLLIVPTAPLTGSAQITLYLVQDVTASTVTAPTVLGASASSPQTPASSQQIPGQTITFPFFVNVGQSLSFELDDVNNVGCSFTIYDPNNQPLGAFLGATYQNRSCSTSGVFGNLPDQLQTAGVYTLVLKPNSSNVGSFKLTLTNVQDNIYSITPSSTGSELTVSTTVGGQNDVITFQVTSAQSITLYLNAVSYSPGAVNGSFDSVRVIDPTGAIVAHISGSLFSPPNSTSASLTTTGLYTIFITPGAFGGSPSNAPVGSTTFTLSSH